MAPARALRLIALKPSRTQHSLVAIHRRALSTSLEAGSAGDPSVHSGDAPTDDYVDRPPKFSGAAEATRGDDKHPTLARTPPSSASSKKRVPPFAPSGKLETQEVADPTGGASHTQKRSWSRAPSRDALETVAETGGVGDKEEMRKGRQEDREYYKTHKPSPIAEVEFADTRKPITRATDGGATDRYAHDDPGGGAMVEDTVDAAIERAEAMFREAAVRGNPAWPHSRALAAMLMRRREGAAGSSAPCGS